MLQSLERPLGVVTFCDSSLLNRRDRTQGGEIQLICGAGTFRLPSVTDGAVASGKVALATSGSVPANFAAWQSASIKRVAPSSFDGEVLTLDRATCAGEQVRWTVHELEHGPLPGIAERALARQTFDIVTRVPVVTLMDNRGAVSAVTTTKLSVKNKRRAGDLAGLRDYYGDGENAAAACLEWIPDPQNLSDRITKRTSRKSDPVRAIKAAAREGRVVIP